MRSQWDCTRHRRHPTPPCFTLSRLFRWRARRVAGKYQAVLLERELDAFAEQVSDLGHGVEGDRGVIGIEQAIDTGAAGFQTLGHGRFADLLAGHRFFQFVGKLELDRRGAAFFQDAIGLEEIFELRSHMFLFHYDYACLFKLFHSLHRQVQFVLRHFLCLLYKTVQQNNCIIVNTEDNPGDSIIQTRADFPQSTPQATHQRSTDGPAVLHFQNVFANNSTFGLWQREQPFSDGLSTVFCLEKQDVSLASLFHSVPKYVQVVKLNRSCFARQLIQMPVLLEPCDEAFEAFGDGDFGFVAELGFGSGEVGVGAFDVAGLGGLFV